MTLTCRTGNLPDSAVNIPGLRASELHELKPLIKCADMIGAIATQTLTGAVESVTLVLEGEYADEKSHPIMLAAARGALSVRTAYPINFVNVKQTAERNKVFLSSVKEAQRPKPRVGVVVKSGTDESIVKCTLMEDGGILMTNFHGVPIWMPIYDRCTGNYVYTKHDDKPGVLAKLTCILGEKKYNIGNLHLGRTVEDGRALGIAIASVDETPSSDLLECIKAIAEVVDCATFTV